MAAQFSEDDAMFEGSDSALGSEQDAEGIVVLSLDREHSSVIHSPAPYWKSSSTSNACLRTAQGRHRGRKAAGFIAGADIREFEQFERARTVWMQSASGRKLNNLARHAAPRWPSMATARRMELSLACHRVASCDPSTHRPARSEAKSFPGWGSPPALPGGRAAALEFMLSGRNASKNARTMGLVDAVTSPKCWSRRVKSSSRLTHRPTPARLVNQHLAQPADLAPIMRKQPQPRRDPLSSPSP
jgi:3-hydroxyacyl-CoA dehydrogenase/enoyl-CoA hydratase/3-hydroxybutyryl-CoA epimerase